MNTYVSDRKRRRFSGNEVIAESRVVVEAFDVMAVIKDSCRSFRDPFDKIAFALHASFIASGYTLSATGEPALECGFSPPLPGQVEIEGWTEGEPYAYVYSKNEKNLTKTVYVRCFVDRDDLEISALRRHEGRLFVEQVPINVGDYTQENSESSNVDDEYKNFDKLVKTLNSAILWWMEDSTKKEESLKER